MKFLPAAVTLSCAALLLGCNRPTAGTSDTDKEDQERLIVEQQAQALSAQHEREAALDERERVLNEREQQLTIAAPPQPAQQEAPPPAASAALPPVAAAVAPPSPDTSYQAFYDDLTPYGSWVQLPGYGYAWQPQATVQDYRWRPYTLGHWVFTDDGWTWVSDEPFGWITYHYGRWMRTHTLGWVWVPGDQWAPAWVSWRYGNDFIGWAPLPPQAGFDGSTPIQQWADDQYNLGPDDYTFVPAAEFGDDTMADVEVPPDQNGPIFDDSNNETDIYYDATTYAIVCYGPGYDFMRSKARRPLAPPLKISRGGYSTGGRHGTVIAGNTLQVTAPRIVKPRTPPAPRVVRGSVADTRLVTPAGPPPRPGVIAQPLYQPPRVAAAQPAVPNLFNAPEQPGAASAPREANPPGQPQLPPRGSGMINQPPPAEHAPPVPRTPSDENTAPAPSDAENARERELILQQQAERAKAEAERADAEARQAEEIHAQQAAAAEHAAQEAEASRADRAQEAARAEAAQASHAAPPAGVPAGTQPTGTVPGRTQQ